MSFGSRAGRGVAWRTWIAQAMANHAPLRILIVEDSEGHVLFLEKLFASSAEMFIHQTAGSLQEALARIEFGDVDVVLLDLSLPDSDGLATFARVVEAAPDLPVVVMSGIQDVNLALETVQLGAQDYL